MFRDVYHQANDDIPVNRELYDSILKSVPKKRKFFYPRITAAASIFILAASVLAYPGIKDSFTGGAPEPEPPYIKAGVATTPKAETEIATVLPDADFGQNEIPSEHPAQTTDNNASVPQDNTASDIPKDNMATASSKAQRAQEPVETTAPASDGTNETVDDHFEPTAENTEPVKSSAPEVTAAAETHAAGPDVKGFNSDEYDRDSFITETWTTQKYFEYLGRTVTPDIPSDLSDVTVSEKDMTLYADSKKPCFDVWSLKYESADKKRTASIKMTKNTQKTQENISAAGDLCEINGTKVNIVTEDGTFLAEGIKDGISYTIEALGLTDKEFESLCLSIYG